mmetsp:Transcript_14072/g.38192  ORF Transcript_14072/g.38192 Transcript_14072/m.38192 type:complete len:243 (-) Transcript_14072:168-896(-)
MLLVQYGMYLCNRSRRVDTRYTEGRSIAIILAQYMQMSLIGVTVGVLVYPFSEGGLPTTFFFVKWVAPMSVYTTIVALLLVRPMVEWWRGARESKKTLRRKWGWVSRVGAVHVQPGPQVSRAQIGLGVGAGPAPRISPTLLGPTESTVALHLAPSGLPSRKSYQASQRSCDRSVKVSASSDSYEDGHAGLREELQLAHDALGRAQDELSEAREEMSELRERNNTLLAKLMEVRKQLDVASHS